MATDVIIIENLDAKNLPELKGWKTKQTKLVKDNPFIEITDTKSYELAKKHRTALLKGRTSLSNQDKLIATKLKEFRNQVADETTKLIDITIEAEQKQQEEVKKYEEILEEILEEKRLEKKRLEDERVKKLVAKIQAIYDKWYNNIKEATFDSIESIGDDLSNFFADIGLLELEEFDVVMEDRCASLKVFFDRTKDSLTNAENQRLEDIRLKKEREDIELEKEKQRKLQEEEIKKRQIAQDEIDKANLKKQEELDKKEAELKAIQNAIYEVERKKLEKIETEIQAKRDKKKLADAQKRIADLKPDLQKLQEAIQFIEFSNEHGDDVELKTVTAKDFFKEIKEELEESKIAWLNQLNNI